MNKSGYLWFLIPFAILALIIVPLILFWIYPSELPSYSDNECEIDYGLGGAFCK